MKLYLKNSWIDQLGMTAAVVCAIHCSILPFILTLLPLLALEFLAHIGVEIAMITLSFIIGCWSMRNSFLKKINLTSVLLFILGFSSIAIGHFVLHELEAFLIPFGGISVALAHWFNWKGIYKPKKKRTA